MPEEFNSVDDFDPYFDEAKKSRIRNLHQYKALSDEEFAPIYEAIISKSLRNPIYERRIEKELKKFAEDYEIGDLKINDQMTLRSMIQSILSLEDYEQLEYKMQKELVADQANYDNILGKLEKLSKIKQVLLDGISKMQDDLKISRKVRQSDRDLSVQSAVDDMKARAKVFYQNKFGRVFCPDCKLLLGSVWVLYPEEKQNRFWFYCKRCDKKVIITFPELVEGKMRNIQDVLDF